MNKYDGFLFEEEDPYTEIRKASITCPLCLCKGLVVERELRSEFLSFEKLAPLYYVCGNCNKSFNI